MRLACVVRPPNGRTALRPSLSTRLPRASIHYTAAPRLVLPSFSGQLRRQQRLQYPTQVRRNNSTPAGSGPIDPPSRVKVFSNGDQYEGDLKDGKPHGQGSFKGEDGSTYVGGFSEGKPEGFGVMNYPSGEEYRGEFQAGERNGRGLYTYSGGDSYDGQWHDGKRHGEGIYRSPNGCSYTGHWVTDRKHGKGVLTISSEDKAVAHNGRYDGEWRHGHRHGQGTYEYLNGDRYVGQWERGQQHGIGTLLGHDGSKRDSAWRAGAQHGPGVFISPDGKAFKATWENGKGYIEEPLEEKPIEATEAPKEGEANRKSLTFSDISAGLQEAEGKGAEEIPDDVIDEVEAMKGLSNDPRLQNVLDDVNFKLLLRGWGSGTVTAEQLNTHPKMKEAIGILEEVSKRNKPIDFRRKRQ